MRFKYTFESLQAAVSESYSVQEVARRLLGKNVGGNQHQHIKKMIQKFGIDTQHFLGSAHNLGQVSHKRKNPNEIFIIGQRQKSHLLKRALIESGINYCCSICQLRDWNNQPIRLEIDHIDGNASDNSLSNLRFLCPNCHSQTETYGYRGQKDHQILNDLNYPQEAKRFGSRL